MWLAVTGITVGGHPGRPPDPKAATPDPSGTRLRPSRPRAPFPTPSPEFPRNSRRAPSLMHFIYPSPDRLKFVLTPCHDVSFRVIFLRLEAQSYNF